MADVVPAPGAHPPAANRVSGRRTLVLAAILILACALSYHNALEGPFIFDDHQSIEQNQNARALWPLTRSMTAPPVAGIAGRPIVSLTVAINYAIGGYDVRGYHVANVLFHTLSALALLGIVRRTFRLPSIALHVPRDPDGLALAIALLWAVHPLLTESVTYVIQRAELLMSLFLLATLYCFIRAAASPTRRGRTGWLTLSVVACATGMGGKEVMVVAPLIVLIYDRLFVAGSFAGALRARRAFYVPLALTVAIVPALLLFTPVAVRSKSAAAFESLRSWDYLKTQAGVLVHYLRLAAWPDKLALDYFDWPVAHSLASVLPQALLICALLGLTAYGVYRGRPLAMLGAWFFLILAPTSSVLPLGTEIAGERRMYLPTVAAVALAVLGAWRGLHWTSRRFAWRPSSLRLAGSLAVLIVAGALIARTVARNDDYRTRVSIYGDAAAKRPNNPRALVNLGIALYETGETAAARQALQRALAIRPGFADAHYFLGVVMLGDTNPEPAAFHFAAATRGRPAWPLPYVGLADLLARGGHTQAAREMYDNARRLAAPAGQQFLVEEIDAKVAALPKDGAPA